MNEQKTTNMLSNVSYNTNCYVAYHKITNKWVRFEQDEEYSHLFGIVLEDDFWKASKFESLITVKIKLERAYIPEQKYGKINLFDLDVAKLKVSYTFNESSVDYENQTNED